MSTPIVQITDNLDGTLTFLSADAAVAAAGGAVTISMDQPRSFEVDGWQSTGTDAFGNQWQMLDVAGWDEPPPSSGNFTPRVNADGSFDAPVFDQPRVLTWTQQVICQSASAAISAKNMIGDLARKLKAGATITAHMPDQDYTVTAKRVGSWPYSSLGSLVFRWAMNVTCVDPFKYGPVQSKVTGLPASGGGLVFPLFSPSGYLSFGTSGVSGQITLTNPGTADAWPTFTITGPVIGGVVLTDVGSGRRIVYSGDVPSSGVLLIVDSASGRATLNGAPRDTELTTSQWWAVPAGGSSTVQFATLGAGGQSGTLAGAIKPAYE